MAVVQVAPEHGRLAVGGAPERRSASPAPSLPPLPPPMPPPASSSGVGHEWASHVAVHTAGGLLGGVGHSCVVGAGAAAAAYQTSIARCGAHRRSARGQLGAWGRAHIAALPVHSLRDVLSFGAFFGVHELALLLAERRRGPGSVPAPEGALDMDLVGSSALAGAAGGSAYAVLAHPCDRAIALSHRDKHRAPRSSPTWMGASHLRTCWQTAQAHGPRLVSVGMVPAMARGAMVGACTFGVYTLCLLNEELENDVSGQKWKSC